MNRLLISVRAEKGRKASETLHFFIFWHIPSHEQLQAGDRRAVWCWKVIKEQSNLPKGWITWPRLMSCTDFTLIAKKGSSPRSECVFNILVSESLISRLLDWFKWPSRKELLPVGGITHLRDIPWKKERFELKNEVRKISCAVKCFAPCADRCSLMASDIYRHVKEIERKFHPEDLGESKRTCKTYQRQRRLKCWGGNSSEREAIIKDDLNSQNTSRGNSVAGIKKWTMTRLLTGRLAD